MTSHILYESLDPENPATFSKVILQDILREKLGFQGVIISDSMNMHALRNYYKPVDAAVAALSAGVDLIMLAEEHYDHDGDYQKRQRDLIDGVSKAIYDGQIPEERLDSAFENIRNVRQRVAMNSPVKSNGGNWRYSSQKAAKKAMRLLVQHQDWSLPDPGCKLVVVRASSEEAFKPVIQTRGIGPNPKKSSFDLFVEELKRFFEVRTGKINENIIDQREDLVIVLENYTLPGMDFDRSLDQTTLNWAKTFSPERLTVIALRDSFDLPEVRPLTTLCTYSFREESAEAAAKWLAGVIKVQNGDAFI
jgi:beta-N-acetylhexosaminidase